MAELVIPDASPAEILRARKRSHLVATLRKLAGRGKDPEGSHREADWALLEYIGDDEVTAIYEHVEKWYA